VAEVDVMRSVGWDLYTAVSPSKSHVCGTTGVD
jgi:hypothetical protein